MSHMLTALDSDCVCMSVCMGVCVSVYVLHSNLCSYFSLSVAVISQASVILGRGQQAAVHDLKCKFKLKLKCKSMPLLYPYKEYISLTVK